MKKIPTPITCRSCGSTPLIREPLVFPDNHPMRGVTISKAKVYCKCGWGGEEFKDLRTSILNWNKIMDTGI